MQSNRDHLGRTAFHGRHAQCELGQFVERLCGVIHDGAHSVAGADLGAEEAELYRLARDQTELAGRQFELGTFLGTLRHDADAPNGGDIPWYGWSRTLQPQIKRARGTRADLDAFP